MNRDNIIATILENMTLVKRGLGSHIHETIKHLPFSPTQIELLYIIRQQQPMSSKALAESRQLTPGAISQLTEGLEAEKLIAREQDTNDRRLQLLRVTKAGEKVLQTVHKRRNELFREIMEDFTDDELTAWMHVQQKIIAKLDKNKP